MEYSEIMDRVIAEVEEKEDAKQLAKNQNAATKKCLTEPGQQIRAVALKRSAVTPQKQPLFFLLILLLLISSFF